MNNLISYIQNIGPSEIQYIYNHLFIEQVAEELAAMDIEFDQLPCQNDVFTIFMRAKANNPNVNIGWHADWNTIRLVYNLIRECYKSGSRIIRSDENYIFWQNYSTIDSPYTLIRPDKVLNLIGTKDKVVAANIKNIKCATKCVTLHFS